MQYSLTLAALVSGTAAFPHMARQLVDAVQKRASAASGESYTGFPTTVFDAADQMVVNDGTYYYKAADFSAGDIRGPCPGLNAAANHGYISRDGITDLVEAIQGTNKVFNMGIDLGGFLSAYSVLTDGNPLSTKWSIGGIGDLGTMLPGQGTGKGLTGSHNKYETDSSPMRGDLYQYGNNYELQLSQFQRFYDYHRGEENPNYTFDDLLAWRKERFTDSVENNPNFFYGAFSGIQVSQAAFTFISAFMSNHSAEYPNGFLSRDTLKSFMGVTESGGNDDGTGTLSFNPGTERIPDNWYRRSSSNPYSIPAFELDAARIFAYDPRTVSVGGNLGETNSYAGINLEDITGGVYNAQNLAEGDNLFCFAKQLLTIGSGDAIQSLTAALGNAVSTITGQYINVLGTCPELTSIDQSNLKEYPGYVADETASAGTLKRRLELLSDEHLSKRAASFAAAKKA
ncbi:Putative uncharacterized protein [Taphrina deformans PYCC 5710]|uniref:Heme haloperoxidase family profile domain-containing protein n=1 Tax=Taphrina deformans (strain PYCC 5710 / ATCC 11124 / CBS 356.35 / IMI 108563 / JCM 9778 / NBRC 8474) TaxID=1097556 RepID=R4XCT8_TAPDE|nr:Putative uncharacterized protein [Taphrina deformans PYCC 5710]|eukprot:CCG81135.1 Putative uncharacterized protein [Taphrina deformans PYCC 5710]